MAIGETNPKAPQTIEKLFDEAVLAYKKRDYHQARELLKIVIDQDPLFISANRRASDLLADVEFQLTEKTSYRRKSRILAATTLFLAIATISLIFFFTLSFMAQKKLQSASAAANSTLAAQTSLLHSAYATVTASSLREESARATMTIMQQNPGSAQATIQSYESLYTTHIPTNAPIFGPHSGSLLHSESNFVIAESAGVNLKNFVVQARFFNPYAANENPFDYGFFFRDTGGDQQFRLVVNSEASWILDYVSDPNWTQVESGSLRNFDRTSGGSNLLKLVVLDDRALFYVNNEFVSTLPTGSKLIPGDIFIVTASYEDHEILGKSTNYEEFTIWPLP